MDFPTIHSQPRPVALSEETRRFAYDSVHFRYGRDTAETPHVVLSASPEMTPLDCYDAGIRLIAEQAPLRICRGEKISGAATLGDAINHTVPFYIEGQRQMACVSHLTVDFESVLKRGVDAIRRDVSDSLRIHTEGEKHRFLLSCIACLDALDVWHGRYLAELKERPEYRQNYEALLRVPQTAFTRRYRAYGLLLLSFASAETGRESGGLIICSDRIWRMI